MQTYGQLVHVEELDRDTIHYRIAVFRVQGGLHSRWSCSACQSDEDETAPSHPTTREAIARTKDLIERHHRGNHAGGSGE